MKEKFNFEHCLRNIKKAIVQLNKFLRDSHYSDHPVKIRELLENLQETSLDFGRLKNSKFKFNHI